MNTHTHRQTDTLTDRRTNRLIDWIGPEGRFSDNLSILWWDKECTVKPFAWGSSRGQSARDYSVGKKGQENMFFSQRIILKDYPRTLKKITFFLSEFILLPEIVTKSSNAIPRRRIFFILQCFFQIFHKSRILVELAETKQKMKKILLVFWCASEDKTHSTFLHPCNYSYQHY